MERPRTIRRRDRDRRYGETQPGRFDIGMPPDPPPESPAGLAPLFKDKRAVPA